MSTQYSHKSPSYYVRKRFFSNKAAVLGLTVIVIAHLIAFLGYLIMPDKTPNATDGALEARKVLPMTEVTILKMWQRNVEKKGFFYRMYNGQENGYSISAINDYEINGYNLTFTALGRKNEKVEAIPLIKVTKDIFSGTSSKLQLDSATAAENDSTFFENFYYKGDTIVYLNSQEEVKTILLEDLIADFKKNNIEKRKYYLGSDSSGRDLLSKLLFGTRISLSIGFVSVMISLLIGVTLGAVAGFFGGKTDAVVMWLMTVVWSVPSIMLVMAIGLALQNKGIWVVFVSVGLTTWVEIARVVRGEIMSIKQKLYVEAAKAFGFSNRTIIIYHILPNMLGSLIVISTSNFASAILIEAGLSFLGFGVQIPTPSWGKMVKEGYDLFLTSQSWHLILFPSLCISIIVLAFNLLGNGLRDAYDPNTVKKY